MICHVRAGRLHVLTRQSSERAFPRGVRGRTTLAVVEPRERTLHLYGAPSDRGQLAWSWVEAQLSTAGTYWLVVRTPGHPHPRPVWGIWHGQRLHLSVGSPTLLRAVNLDPLVTVHLDSGTDVVLLEGTISRTTQYETPSSIVQAYNAKYDWDYQVAQYGELIVVQPQRVLAWRTAGWAGRDSFQATGCWQFDSPQ